eukprot:632860_1
MSTGIQFIVSAIYALCALSKAKDACDFTPPQNLTEYNTYYSLTNMCYLSGAPPNETTRYRGTWNRIGGVNNDGTIYVVGGTWNWKQFGEITREEPCQFWDRINVYDSFIAYDKSVDIGKTLTQIQEPWSSSLDAPPYFSMPNPTRPTDRVYPITWTAEFPWDFQGGFYCQAQCSTYLNNRIYIINPMFISQFIAGGAPQSSADWPLMLVFDMNDDAPRWLNESEFESVLPNNFWAAGKNGTGPYDILEIAKQGCTTHNGTHIFHFNWAENQVGTQYLYDPYSTTYAYDPQSDEWSVLTGNPHDKFQFTCSSDLSGRYIYLIAGNFMYEAAGSTEVNVDSFETDQYDTWTDSWTRLPHTADYPEQYGRWDAYSVLDRSTNSIVVIGGTIMLNPCSENCEVSVTKVEIFRCDTLDWYVPSDPMDQIHFESSPKTASVVIVHDFVPPGQTSNKSADIIFALGGWGENKIQYMTMLTEQEYYPDNIVRIEGQYPEDDAIEFTAFDPWQRFELAFRIVITDGIGYEIDDTWDISFSIDGKSIADINDEYATQILARPACQCGRNEVMRCENMPDNVIQVTTVELMIPSRRPLHNGYCVDRDLPHIFSYETPSNITITATNGAVTHERDFTFEFMKIELISPHLANSAGVFRGCKVTKPSHGTLTKFEISCDGYTCDKCPRNYGIGRDSQKGRNKAALKYEIEYNILMNDVLLAPGGYVRQDYEEYSVIGTESLNTDSLIALIRARTAVGTWYQECFYNFSYEFTKDWQSLSSILDGKTQQELWEDVVANLNSINNEDVVAAYSILNEMIVEDEVPTGEDPSTEITGALQNIMDRMDDDTTDITIADVTANLALVQLLTTDTSLVEPEIVLAISSEFIPNVLNQTLALLNDSESVYEPGVLADTVQNIGEIANSAASNLLNVTNLTEPARQQLVVDVQEIMTTGMTGSWHGEVILLINDQSTTKGYTIKKTDACELNDIVIQIPPDNAATSSDTVKCVITETSEEVAVDVFSGSGTRVYTTNNTCFPYFITMNLPDTYDGVFDRALAGDWFNSSIQYPQCTFWNTSEETWSGKGCMVYEYDADTVTCACTHLTTFKMSAEDFDPKAELITEHDLRQFSTENIQQHPTTWVTMVMIVVVLFVACICVPNNTADRPIIAFEDIIYKEFRDQYLHKHQQWHEIQQIDRWYGKIAEHKRELSRAVGDDTYASSGGFGVTVNPESPHSPASPSSVAIPESPSSRNAFAEAATFDFKPRITRSKYYCLLSVNLFKTYLKNDHTVLSVFQRTDGTNFSTKQRIGLFLLYMYMVMMADAIFYGRQEERRPMGELTASALISLAGTVPVFLVRMLFQWSKPTVIKSARALPPLMTDANTNTSRSKANKDVQMLADIISSSTEDGEETEAQKKDEAKNQKHVSTQYWSAIAKLKHTSRPDMKLVRKCMDYVNTEAHASDKATLTAEIRLILFNYNYPFPHWCKKIAWAILITLSLVCIMTSVIYGIRFDLRAEEMATQVGNEEHVLAQMTDTGNTDTCWGNMSIQLEAQTQVLAAQVVEIREEQARIEALEEPYEDDFAVIFGDEAIYDSTKWLLNVLISFLLSVFIWQPSSIYFFTWLKIWAFHNGWVMEASLANAAMFVASYLCCGCVLCGNCLSKRNKYKKMAGTKNGTTMLRGAKSAETAISVSLPTITPDPNNAEKAPELSVTELSITGHTRSTYDTMLTDDRELDIISFLCLDDLFNNLPQDLNVELDQIAYD